jgi:hypothetical protein
MPSRRSLSLWLIVFLIRHQQLETSQSRSSVKLCPLLDILLSKESSPLLSLLCKTQSNQSLRKLKASVVLALPLSRQLPCKKQQLKLKLPMDHLQQLPIKNRQDPL